MITNKPAQLFYATIYGYTHTFHEKYFKNSRNAHNFMADEDIRLRNIFMDSISQ